MRENWREDLVAMDRVITESGMEFAAENTFYIEKSELYLGLGEGIKSIEFIRIKERKLLFIEAKTTFPNPNNPNAENLVRFHAEIDDIRDKFIHSLNLLSSVEVGVAQSEYDGDFALPERVTLEFYLVIRNHESAWCKDVEKTLMAAFPPYIKKIWKPVVYVINREIAVKRELVVA